MLTNGLGILAFRNPYGIRPLCFGTRKSVGTTGVETVDYAVASEIVAIDALYKFNLESGEYVSLDLIR